MKNKQLRKAVSKIHIALNTWIVIALSGILTTLAACQAPTTQPKPVQAPSPAQTPTFPNTVANTNTRHNNPKVPVKTFALPADTQIPTDLAQGEQRILYVDHKNGNRIILTTPQKQEAFKDFAVKQLLPPAQQPYPLNTVGANQVESVINVRHNPNYCKVYELKIERPQKPLRDQNLCDNLRYKVVINGEPWAELIATDVFFLAPPSNVPATVGENRYVFAPCEEACDQPLKVEIFKSPGAACALNPGGSGLRKNPASYTGLDSMDKVTEFDYDDCQNREILNLYYDASVRQLLDSVEKRLDVMKVNTELLMEEVKEAYPDAGDFNVSAVKVPAHYYERETTFQTQQYNDGFDEYDDYYDDFDEYNDGYDDYDDSYDDGYDDYDDFYQDDDGTECPGGNCVKSGDIRKDIADFQNERLVQEVELLRKKVAWVEQTIEQQGFQTQQFNSDDFYDQRRKLKNDFYNVDTSGGCYNFYSNNARPKNPKPRNDDNGGGGSGGGGNTPYEERCHGEDPSITLFSATVNEDLQLVLRGRVNHPPETCGKTPFNYQSLSPVPDELLLIPEAPTVEHHGFGFFSMTLTNAQTTDAFNNRLVQTGRFPKTKIKIESCQSGTCLRSNSMVARFLTLANGNAEAEIETEQDFSTQATGSQCPFPVIGGPKSQPNTYINVSIHFFLGLKQKIVQKFPRITASGQFRTNIYKKTKPTTLHLTSRVSVDATSATSADMIATTSVDKPTLEVFSVSNHLKNVLNPHISLRMAWNGGGSNGAAGSTGTYKVSNLPQGSFYIIFLGDIPVLKAYPTFLFPGNPEVTIFNFDEFRNKNIANTPRCKFSNPGKKTIATYRFENAFGSLQALGDQPAENVACSGNPSAAGTTPTPTQGIFGEWGDLKFPPEIDEKKQGKKFPFKSVNDAERKILELFAKKHNAHFNQDGSIKTNTLLEGNLFMFVNREACPQCQKLPQQFRKLFPKVGLHWIDSNGTCY